MGYRFTGFFCDGDRTVLTAALDRWPFCVGKAIDTPFTGTGLRCPDIDEMWESEEGHDYWEERISSVERELADFSTGFPERTFSFVQAECFGGDCDHAGFVVRNGDMILTIGFDEGAIDRLRQLLEPLGVRLSSGVFPPFARGYWTDA